MRGWKSFPDRGHDTLIPALLIGVILMLEQGTQHADEVTSEV